MQKVEKAKEKKSLKESGNRSVCAWAVIGIFNYFLKYDVWSRQRK